jgi:hypothetical protein
MGVCAGCAEPECPYEPPQQGDSCGECAAPSGDCHYESCGDFGVGKAHCDGSEWQVNASACEAAPPCGGDGTAEPCADDEICVRVEITTGPDTDVTFSCEPHPCRPLETTCDCAQSICTAKSAPLCLATSERMLNCSNDGQ